jgi:hypothetical protein
MNKYCVILQNPDNDLPPLIVRDWKSGDLFLTEDKKEALDRLEQMRWGFAGYIYRLAKIEFVSEE